MVGPIIDLEAVRKLRSLSVELRQSSVFVYKFALDVALAMGIILSGN